MKTNVVARLSLAVSLAAASTASLRAAEFFYAQTTATQSYSTFVGPIPIGGLAFVVPPASKDFNAAVITLNLPNLTLSDPTTTGAILGATLQLVAPFSSAGPVVATATIGGCDKCTSVPGTQGVTIVAKIPLSTVSEPVEAEWESNGNCTVTTQSFASISAILVKE
jgi:hypothetical protein